MGCCNRLRFTELKWREIMDPKRTKPMQNNACCWKIEEKDTTNMKGIIVRVFDLEKIENICNVKKEMLFGT